MLARHIKFVNQRFQLQRFCLQKQILSSETDLNFITEQAKQITQEIDPLKQYSAFNPYFWYLQIDNCLRDFFLMNLTTNYGLASALIISGIGMKLLMVPTSWKMQIQSKKMTLLQKDVQMFQQQISELIQRKADQAQLKEVQLKLMRLYAKHDVNPMSGFRSLLLQMPLMLIVFLMIQYTLTKPELYPIIQNQSFLWIKDLTQPDYILPCISSFAIFASMNLSYQDMPENPMKPFFKMMQLLPFLSIFPFCFFPSGLVLYFSVFSGLNLLQMVIFRSNWAKGKQNIPQYLPETIKELDYQLDQCIIDKQEYQEKIQSLYGFNNVNYQQTYDNVEQYEETKKEIEKIMSNSELTQNEKIERFQELLNKQKQTKE